LVINPLNSEIKISGAKKRGAKVGTSF